MKKTLTKLELAELLLKLFKEHKYVFSSGLCLFILLLYCDNVITFEECNELTGFIQCNNPKYKENRIWYSMFRKENNMGFYFKPGNYNRRLRFLKSLVKEYSKK